MPRAQGKDGGILGPAGGLGMLRKGLLGKLMGNSGAGEEASPGYGGFGAYGEQPPQEFGEAKSYMHYGDF
jgi:hypothetical protein